MKNVMFKIIGFLFIFFLVGNFMNTSTKAINGERQYMGANSFIISGDYLKLEIETVQSMKEDPRYVFSQEGGADNCVHVLEMAIKSKNFVCTKVHLFPDGKRHYACYVLP